MQQLIPDTPLRPTILAVDDAIENLMIIESILENDYDIKLFNNAHEAIIYAFATPPDLILLDILMPEIDGFECCRRFKSNAKLSNVPIIFISMKNDIVNEALGFSLGASDFIHKPISAPLVAARVKTHLKIKFMLDEQTNRREQVEIALNELSQLHQSIITEADSGVMVYLPEGSCILANRAAARIFGISPEQIRQTSYLDKTWGNFGLPNAAREALQSGITQKINAPVHSSFGTEFWCMASVGRIVRREGEPYILVIFSDISAYKEIERKVIEISEETKRSVGQELHDDLGQHLTGIAFMSEALSRQLKNQKHPLAHKASSVTVMVNEAISKTRSLAHGLYPEVLAHSGLRTMLQQLSSNIESLYQVHCQLICEQEYEVDDSLTIINLFRISQEALNNAIKHGKATKITLKLICKHKLTILEISDNGCGINNSISYKNRSGMGMHTMQYRVSLLGGNLHIHSQPGEGTTLLITLPLQHLLHMTNLN